VFCLNYKRVSFDKYKCCVFWLLLSIVITILSHIMYLCKDYGSLVLFSTSCYSRIYIKKTTRKGEKKFNFATRDIGNFSSSFSPNSKPHFNLIGKKIQIIVIESESTIRWFILELSIFSISNFFHFDNYQLTHPMYISLCFH
jgi:hypothetical protein